MDDDDGILIPLEQKAERLARAAAVDVWKEKKQTKAIDGGTSKLGDDDDETNIYAVPDDKDDVGLGVKFCFVNYFSVLLWQFFMIRSTVQQVKIYCVV